MGRYSDLYKEIHGKEPTEFPEPLNEILEVGKSYKIKLLTDPRKVRAGFGRETPIVEVEYKEKKYTLYLSWIDLLNRFALLEKESDKRGINLKGKHVVVERHSKYRFRVRLAEPG
jgi:hypothetical protein